MKAYLPELGIRPIRPQCVALLSHRPDITKEEYNRILMLLNPEANPRWLIQRIGQVWCEIKRKKPATQQPASKHPSPSQQSA